MKNRKAIKIAIKRRNKLMSHWYPSDSGVLPKKRPLSKNILRKQPK